MRLRFCVILPILASLASMTVSAANRRALLIAINNYNPKAEARAELEKKPVAHTVSRPNVPGGWTLTKYPNLSGAVADAQVMKDLLISVFEFRDEEFAPPLYNQDATADAILSALRRELIDQAHPGDIRFIYYSGHGGTAKNKATNGIDETIVPADHWRDVPDIRDKELSRIFFAAAKKGVIVTMVADSCHSGSLSRGAWNAVGTPKSSLDPHLIEVDDKPDIDGETKQPIDPANVRAPGVGLLLFSAAQRDNEALEVKDEDFQDHGAFTLALKQALSQGSTRADLVEQRVGSFLKANAQPQQPVLEGSASRKNMSLIGEPANETKGLVVTAGPVTETSVRLRAGSVLGIAENSEFVRLDKKQPAVRLRITKIIGPAESDASIVGGTVRTGDQFLIDKIVYPPASALVAAIEKSAAPERILEMASQVAQVSSAGVHVVVDSTVERPTHVIFWTGKDWTLETHPSTSAAVALGSSPTSAAILSNLAPNAKLLVLYPPTPDLAANLELGRDENTSVTLTNSLAGAQYRLNGRFVNGALEYAWTQPDATEDSVREQISGVKTSSRMAMPLRSDWIPAGAGKGEDAERAGRALTDKALRIARVRAWLMLPAPPDHAPNTFPYKLAFRQVGSQDVSTPNVMKGKARFKIVLRATEQDLRRVDYQIKPRYVYVFAVDHFGRGSLIWPVLGHGNEGNILPHGPDPKKPMQAINVGEEVQGGQHTLSISPPEVEYDFEVDEPYGVDTFFLMTSEEPISNPDVFEFDGARSKGSRGFANDPLTGLLSEIGTTSRAASAYRPPVPVNWGIERIIVLSVP